MNPQNIQKLIELKGGINDSTAFVISFQKDRNIREKIKKEIVLNNTMKQLRPDRHVQNALTNTSRVCILLKHTQRFL